jgi:hypothetical protein
VRGVLPSAVAERPPVGKPAAEGLGRPVVCSLLDAGRRRVLPVLGALLPEQAVTKLREIGEVSKWIGGHGTAAFGDGRVDGS